MKYIWGTLRVINFLLAIFMMYAGIITAFGGVTGLGQPLDLLIGLVFFGSGLTLFLGKLFQWSKATGWGLLLVYLCFIFGGIVNWASSGSFAVGLPNFIASGIVGLLYLRWKYHLFYVEPRVKESHEAERSALRNRRINEAYQREHDSRRR